MIGVVEARGLSRAEPVEVGARFVRVPRCYGRGVAVAEDTVSGELLLAPASEHPLSRAESVVCGVARHGADYRLGRFLKPSLVRLDSSNVAFLEGVQPHENCVRAFLSGSSLRLAPGVTACVEAEIFSGSELDGRGTVSGTIVVHLGDGSCNSLRGVIPVRRLHYTSLPGRGNAVEIPHPVRAQDIAVECARGSEGACTLTFGGSPQPPPPAPVAAPRLFDFAVPEWVQARERAMATPPVTAPAPARVRSAPAGGDRPPPRRVDRVHHLDGSGDVLMTEAEEDDRPQCVGCLSAPAAHRLEPCGHFSLCGVCQERSDAIGELRRCPMCRASIDTVVTSTSTASRRH